MPVQVIKFDHNVHINTAETRLEDQWIGDELRVSTTLIEDEDVPTIHWRGWR